MALDALAGSPTGRIGDHVCVVGSLGENPATAQAGVIRPADSRYVMETVGPRQ